MSKAWVSSWVRRGAAAGILEADPVVGPYAAPATFKPAVVPTRDGTAQPALSGPELPLLGPGAVVGLDAQGVLRTDPPDGAVGVEDNFLPLIEFRRPDLPWMFTPARPGAGNRLRPWLVLVVVEESLANWQAGRPLPRISVPDGELPDLADSWAWAHAQAALDADDLASAQAALQPAESPQGLSRLLCPRRLAADKAYLACVVPATRPGVVAGLGLPAEAGPQIAPAWSVGAGQTVTLPVYFHWRFSTGDAGDFKSLLLRLKGVRATDVPGFGTRPVDMSQPWPGAPLAAAAQTALDGAIGSGVADPGWTADPALRTSFETSIEKAVDFPASLQPANAVGDPTLNAVAPPLYGGHPAGQSILPAAGWLRTLNLDPRRRMAAALGADYVRAHKEFLMARAWEQLGAIQDANRRTAWAEMAAVVADRLHARHLPGMTESQRMVFAAPARSRLRVLAGTTLQAQAQASSLATGAQTNAYARLARPTGPLGRRAYGGQAATLVTRTLSQQLVQPALRLDGIAQLAAQPAAPTKDASARVASIAWAGVLGAESALSLPANLQTTRVAQGHVAAPANVPLVFKVGVITPLPPSPARPAAASLPAAVTGALLPSAALVRRLAGRVVVPPRLQRGDPFARLMAGPSFPAPLAMALLQEQPNAVLPGLGNFPADRVTLLAINPAFVEALMVGANHEMNRELLWREYPTDQRGSPFRWFWPRPDGRPDISPIAAWQGVDALGSHLATASPDGGAMAVLLVRGELMRRFPGTVPYAAPGVMANGVPTLAPDGNWTPPQFAIRVDASSALFAYPLSEAMLRSNRAAGQAGWYLVFSEPATRPRFNFDDPPDRPLNLWTDLGWNQLPQSRGFAIASTPLAKPPGENAPDAPLWNHDAADMARIAVARPVRVAFHADELLPPAA